MSKVKDKLIEVCGYSCMLGGKISKHNNLTYHHLNPKRCGGRKSFKNGVLITKSMHHLINRIESKSKDDMEYITEYMVKLKKMRYKQYKERIGRII